MVFILLAIALQLLMGCNQRQEARVLDFKAFTLDVPTGWYKVKRQGIDSYVGGLTNGGDTLFFDFGWYSYDFKYEDLETQLFTIDTINGKKTTLTKPKSVGKGIIGMYIANAYQDSHFTLIGRNIEDEQTVFNIFQSIQFQDSDTSLNSIKFAENFSLRSHPFSAESIFLDYCAQCHSFSNNELIGPGLATIAKERFDQWFLDTSFVYTPEPPFEHFGAEYHRSLVKEFSLEEIELMKELFKEN